ncbi:MAG: hypothetical protein K6U08_10300 [Firmicutes bacterium]|nr:hypothetical protein [Bacillota bacterium]
MVLLVKPQFEAGRDKVGSRGVVRDPEVHVEVLDRVISGLTAGERAVAAGLTYSPLRGPEGNVEYLLWLKSAEGEKGAAAREGEDGRPGASDPSARPFSISDVVREAVTLGDGWPGGRGGTGGGGARQRDRYRPRRENGSG